MTNKKGPQTNCRRRVKPENGIVNILYIEQLKYTTDSQSWSVLREYYCLLGQAIAQNRHILARTLLEEIQRKRGVNYVG